METFSALLAICAGNSPVSGEFPAQRPVTRSFDVFFDVRVWVNTREAGHLRRYRIHYDVIVMWKYRLRKGGHFVQGSELNHAFSITHWRTYHHVLYFYKYSVSYGYEMRSEWCPKSIN